MSFKYERPRIVDVLITTTNHTVSYKITVGSSRIGQVSYFYDFNKSGKLRDVYYRRRFIDNCAFTIVYKRTAYKIKGRRGNYLYYKLSRFCYQVSRRLYVKEISLQNS